MMRKNYILELKSSTFAFGWGSAPDPAGGAYSTPPVPLAGFKGKEERGRKGPRGTKGVREGEMERRGRHSLARPLA